MELMNETAQTGNRGQTLRHTKPLWEPRRGRGGSNYWQVYSPKIDRRVKFYSNLEYHHWILVEATPEIAAFCERPIKVLGVNDGKNGSSLIDMWVQWRNGAEEYRELKYAKKLDQLDEKPALRRLLELQKAWCERREIAHQVLTDNEVYANKLQLRNWQLILAQLANTRDLDLDKIQESIRQIVAEEGTISLLALSRWFDGVPPTSIRGAVFRLIHAGELQAPLDQAVLTEAIPLRSSHELSVQG
ncbi:hypothetical protein GEOBC_02372 [Geobacteraceae bacterium]|nr:hypothetical protein GEOBC_02372 [Geobacteraceae bacterium]